MRGTLCELQKLGFGMVLGEDGLEVFFDQRALVGTEISELAIGQRVEYDIEHGPEGRRAVNIKVVEGHRPAGMGIVEVERENP
jgi:cold shock CspA family protein